MKNAPRLIVATVLAFLACAPTQQAIRDYVPQSKYKRLLVLVFETKDEDLNMGVAAANIFSERLHDLGFRLVDRQYALDLIEARTGRKGSEITWDDLAGIAQDLSVNGIVTGAVGDHGEQLLARSLFSDISTQTTTSGSPIESAPSSPLAVQASPTPTASSTVLGGLPSESPTPLASATAFPTPVPLPTLEPFYAPTPTANVVVSYSALAKLTDVKTGRELWSAQKSRAHNNATFESVRNHVMADLARDLGYQLLKTGY